MIGGSKTPSEFWAWMVGVTVMAWVAYNLLIQGFWNNKSSIYPNMGLETLVLWL